MPEVTMIGLNKAKIGGLRPPIPIFKAHNIVLAKIAARLHFDQLKRHLARVL
jgi:hypothetical protein